MISIDEPALLSVLRTKDGGMNFAFAPKSHS
jgi:hypothetical protein